MELNTQLHYPHNILLIMYVHGFICMARTRAIFYAIKHVYTIALANTLYGIPNKRFGDHWRRF